MNRFATLLLPAVLSAGLLTGCETFRGGDSDHADHQSVKADDRNQPTAIATLKPSGIAATLPTKNVAGVVTFTELKDGVRITANVTGLPPNSTHGFHIHEKGDLGADDLASAGGHYNPSGARHGGPDKEMHHKGDLGNIQSDAQGNATLDVVMKGITLEGENPIVGRSIVLHAGPDDLKTDPAGDSGARVAGGIIEMKK